MSKLASIEKVLSLEPIEGADRIELARVLGYDCVVKKGDFKVGDWCIWINPDTIVPNRPEFEFLAKENYRIKVRRFKGKYSRGLAWPVHVEEEFPGVLVATTPLAMVQFTIGEGLDITDMIDVKKYEVPVPVQLAGQVKGSFPAFIKKTDEENLCKWPGLLSELNEKDVCITHKYDGTSATFYLNNGEFGVCSRNMDLKETEGSVYWKIAREYDIENKLRQYGKNVAIQGEIYGPGIQSNRAGADKIMLAVFNGFDIDAYRYFTVAELDGFCITNKFPQVTKICFATIQNATIESLQELADKQVYPGTDKPCEGIVIRPLVEERSVVLDGRLSCKVISNKYAVKHGL